MLKNIGKIGFIGNPKSSSSIEGNLSIVLNLHDTKDFNSLDFGNSSNYIAENDYIIDFGHSYNYFEDFNDLRINIFQNNILLNSEIYTTNLQIEVPTKDFIIQILNINTQKEQNIYIDYLRTKTLDIYLSIIETE